MSTKLILAIVTISLALVFYTVGVWTEHKQKNLKWQNLVFFWLGLVFDTTGTTIMTSISQSSGTNGFMSVHGITGALTIVLMIIHAVWATVVSARKNEKAQHTFHRFSIVVWCIWLIPYLIGVFMGMNH